MSSLRTSRTLSYLKMNGCNVNTLIPLITNCKRSRSYASSSKPSPKMTDEILWRSINRDSGKKIAPISFNHVYERTKNLATIKYNNLSEIEHLLISDAQRVQSQSPLRISKLITCLQNLPYGLSKTSSISSLMDIYIATYETLLEHQNDKLCNIADCDKYYNVHRGLLIKHILAIPKICYALLEKATEKNSVFSIENCGDFLTAFINQFATQRLSARVMSAHNLTIFDQIVNGSNNKMGLFEEDCDVLKYIKEAIFDASQDCEHHFVDYDEDNAFNAGQAFAPKVNCYDFRKNKNGNNFTYIPQHLHHMNFELLKNSMRAVIENKDKISKHEREIDIVVVDSDDGSITIKISDNGGGIARNVQKELIWLYGYTTAFDGYGELQDKLNKHKQTLGEVINSAEQQWGYDYNNYKSTENDKSFDVSVLGAVKYTPLCGLGYGLPITKLYANYFGGNCKIQSIDGYGTDAYLYINNLSKSNTIII